MYFKVHWACIRWNSWLTLFLLELSNSISNAVSTHIYASTVVHRVLHFVLSFAHRLPSLLCIYSFISLTQVGMILILKVLLIPLQLLVRLLGFGASGVVQGTLKPSTPALLATSWLNYRFIRCIGPISLLRRIRPCSLHLCVCPVIGCNCFSMRAREVGLSCKSWNN